MTVSATDCCWKVTVLCGVSYVDYNSTLLMWH